MFVKELEITLENGMKISGELDLPERQGQWKTIILFHGSGPSDRHATVNIKLSVQWVLKVTLSSCEMQKEMEVSEVCNLH